ncbi:hypothetical protein PACTADRAFT_50491 [Pachysolen tannophilus NRRL Y-2460]|uniref:Uncharacterized protein n=1 Tax=Pachysolen tannophilus NRRL Y-2460 TaxID=669874 RepID=A0A1E4TS88_PACTA|nr:hypothetical protein PACTADRAFT_50491 [Pachysolen tannophilus NRRL Y-2460]
MLKLIGGRRVLSASKCGLRFEQSCYLSTDEKSNTRRNVKNALNDYDITNSLKTLSIPDSQVSEFSLSHSYLRGSETYGQLVQDYHYALNEPENPKFKIIDHKELKEAYSEYRDQETGEFLNNGSRNSEESRLHPNTLKGRVNRDQIELPDVISETINEYMLIRNEPKMLRTKASEIYVQLYQNELLEPSKDTELDVDAHIASLFLQNYGAAYQTIFELKNRISKFNPQKILDVGYGPATGMVALNEIMGEDFNPLIKHSFIVGPYEMQKRAKIILSRQLCEYNVNDNNSSLTKDELDIEHQNFESITGEDDIVGNVDTKQIKIRTKFLKEIPTSHKYDMILLNHQLLTNKEHFPLEIDDKLDFYLSKLAPGGHLLVIERGTPLGFETIARARQVAIRPENYPNSNTKIPRLYIKGSDFKPKNEIIVQSNVGVKDFIDSEFESDINNDQNLYEVDQRPNYHLKVIAPCQHHGNCPLQLKNPEYYSFGKIGKKLSWCHFERTIKRPKFSIELKKGLRLATRWDSPLDGTGVKGSATGGSGRPNGKDYEVLTYSYLILERSLNDRASLDKIAERTLSNETHNFGHTATNNDSIEEWSRVMKTPLKKKGQIVAEVCNPSGFIEKWIIPKSFGKQEFHDARKLIGGDLWALDAKTKLMASSNAENYLSKLQEKEKQKLAERSLELKLLHKNKRDILNRLANVDYDNDHDKISSLEDKLNQISSIVSNEFEQKPKERKNKKKYKF